MFKFIQTSSRGVKTTFGKFTKISEPGLNIYVPFVQQIHIVSNRLSQNTFKYEVKTSDNVFAELRIAVQYKIKSENTELAFYSFDDPIKQMDAYIGDALRSIVPQKTLDELFKLQNDICESVQTSLLAKMDQCGYSIENTLVTEINPHKSVKEALNKIQESTLLKEAAREEADAKYILAYREAEADKDRKILQGEGISGQRLAILKGYQDGINEMADSLGVFPKVIIDFVLKTQHLDTIATIGKSPNAKTIFVDHNVSSVTSDILKANADTKNKNEE